MTTTLRYGVIRVGRRAVLIQVGKSFAEQRECGGHLVVAGYIAPG